MQRDKALDEIVSVAEERDSVRKARRSAQRGYLGKDFVLFPGRRLIAPMIRGRLSGFASLHPFYFLVVSTGHGGTCYRSRTGRFGFKDSL
jgi:hypothetical protein